MQAKYRVADSETQMGTGSDTLPSADGFLPDKLEAVGMLSVCWLGVLVGVQAMFGAFFALGRKPVSRDMMAQFTEWGQFLYRPEREIPLYLLGCALTFALSIGMTRAWMRCMAALRQQDRPSAALASAAFNLTVVLIGTPINFIWLMFLRSMILRQPWLTGGRSVVYLLLILIPAAAEAGLFLMSLAKPERLLRHQASLLSLPFLWLQNLLGRGETEREDASAGPSQPSNLSRESEASASMRSVPTANKITPHWMDALMPLLVILIVYIPHPDVIAGMIFQTEHFHHWDFFVMGPAIGFLHGGALCTQVYTQYGIGFPLLFASLNPVYPLSYGHLIQSVNIYGCLYFMGVYLFLRLLLKSPFWATFGTLLTITYKVFNWVGDTNPCWQLPSNTIFRAPFDIWFLLALLMHQRTRRDAWLLAAGALTGASLLFETDTGAYTLFTFAVYCLLWRGSEIRSAPAPRAGQCGRLLFASWLAAALVLLGGMEIASRGTLGQAAFWRGWTEAFTAYPSGFSMVPIIEIQPGLKRATVMMSGYLLALSYFYGRFRRGLVRPLSPSALQESGGPSNLLLMCVALYGTCTLLHFVGRSNDTNLFVGSLGFALLVTVGLCRFTRHLDQRWPRQSIWRGVRLACLAALCLYGVKYWRHIHRGLQYPGVSYLLLRTYPVREIQLYVGPNQEPLDPHTSSAQQHWLWGSEKMGEMELYPGSNVTVPRSITPKLQAYFPVVAEMRQLNAQHKRAAILANDETWLYLASGMHTWYRYSPLYPNLITRAQVSRAEKTLLSEKMDYVYIETEEPLQTFAGWYPMLTRSTWTELSDFTRAHYTFDHQCGKFSVYRR